MNAKKANREPLNAHLDEQRTKLEQLEDNVEQSVAENKITLTKMLTPILKNVDDKMDALNDTDKDKDKVD